MDNTGLKVEISGLDDRVGISLIPPVGAKRTPTDICCVIDTSGSMSADATLKTEQGANESTGLSVLDVVKHSVKTIINSLEPGDRLALVQFNNIGKVILELTDMDDAGRNKAQAAVEALHASGSTNLWDGLLKGLDHLQGKAGGNAALLLLTDGEPTDHPPGGYAQSLIKRKADKPLPCSISTFGFGYSLDSHLLDEIAAVGNGKYYFIPDSGLVGTVFVNCISNLLSTYTPDVSVTIDVKEGTRKKIKNDGTLSGFPFTATKTGFRLNVGSVALGQSRDIILEFKEKVDLADISVSATYHPCDQHGKQAITVQGYQVTGTPETLLQSYYRVQIVHQINMIMKRKNRDEAKTQIETLLEQMEKDLDSSPFSTDLKKDLDGQISESISKQEYFNKWGRHYLPSLACAHLYQQCNNFKDFGVQHYGGEVFFGLRDKIDEIFLQIPPPTPTRRAAQAAPVNMGGYYNQYGG